MICRHGNVHFMKGTFSQVQGYFIIIIFLKVIIWFFQELEVCYLGDRCKQNNLAGLGRGTKHLHFTHSWSS